MILELSRRALRISACQSVSTTLPSFSGKVSSFLNLEVEKFIIIILPNVGGGKKCLYYFRNRDHLLHLEPSLLMKPKIHFHFGGHCFKGLNNTCSP